MRRVVLDTNVWVSASLNPQGAPAAVVQALLAGEFALVISQPIIDEYRAVMARPRISQRCNLDTAQVDRVRVLLESAPTLTPVLGTVRLCRDPDDDIILETAVRGGADTLVSRDEDVTRAPDLLAALAAHGIEIMTVRQFLAALRTEQPD